MKDFEKLYEYMNIYIQLMTYCYEYGGHRLHKVMLPTFDYFVEHYDSDAYSLNKPHFIDVIGMNGTGLETKKIGPYIYFNYWQGCKYYTGNNIEGIYIKDECVHKPYVYEEYKKRQHEMMLEYLYGIDDPICSNIIKKGDKVEYIDTRYTKQLQKSEKITIYGIWDGSKVVCTDKDKTIVYKKEWLTKIE